jgi:hypothetical protein
MQRIFQEIKITATTVSLPIPYILESNPHLVFATFLNEKKLVHLLYHFSKIQL